MKLLNRGQFPRLQQDADRLIQLPAPYIFCEESEVCVQKIHQRMRACGQQMAAGRLPVRRHPEHHCLRRRDAGHRHGAFEGAERMGLQRRLLGSAGLLHADGTGAGAGQCHGLRQALQKGAAGRGRHVSQQHAGHRGHHLCFHRLLLAELGLRSGHRRPAGQGGGAPCAYRGLPPADRLRLLRLRHLARRTVRLHPSGSGGRQDLWRSAVSGPHHRHRVPSHEPDHVRRDPAGHALCQLRHASRQGPYHHH